jgi:hypothetical protein
MKQYLLEKADRRKLLAFDDYLNSTEGINIKAINILSIATDNIKHIELDGSIVIYINDKVLIKGTDKRLIDICRLINYGNLLVQGYPIFTKTFNHFSNNIDFYISLYKAVK